MHNNPSIFNATGVTDLLGSPAWSPADRQLLEQLEQLQPRSPYERLSIAVFVLTEALRRAPIGWPPARMQTEQLLAALLATRALPPCTQGWAVLFGALNELVASLTRPLGLLDVAIERRPGLLGESIEKPTRPWPAYECAHQLVVAVQQQDAGHAMFTGAANVPGPDAGGWASLRDVRLRLREVIAAQAPWAPEHLLFNAQQIDLLEKHPETKRPVLCNRILGAEVLCPLPEHLTWRITRDVVPYVEADLSRFGCDWDWGCITLAEDVQLQIAVQEPEHLKWVADGLREFRARHPRPTGGNIHIGHIISGSPGAILSAPTAAGPQTANVTVTAPGSVEPGRQAESGAASEPQEMKLESELPGAVKLRRPPAGRKGTNKGGGQPHSLHKPAEAYAKALISGARSRKPPYQYGEFRKDLRDWIEKQDGPLPDLKTIDQRWPAKFWAKRQRKRWLNSA
jgi:hypothetical protein